jgi:hypothetical protein
MKQVNKNIDQDIGKTLAAFDDIKKASPRPFFYTRVMAKREKYAAALEREQISPVMMRITVSALFILFFISLYSVVTVQRNDSALNPSSATTEIESFIEDYYPQTPTVYNFDEKINQ